MKLNLKTDCFFPFLIVVNLTRLFEYFLKDLTKNNISNEKNVLNLLWECCQIPDFVKKTYGNHLEVVSKVFGFLNGKDKKITNNFMKKQLSVLDKLEGNVDSLSNRIANVRTWFDCDYPL